MNLPPLYFRIKENGAAVFRTETEGPQGRLELEPIATLNIRNGDIKPQGDRLISDAERAEIEAWIKARQALLATRAQDDMHRAIEQINLLTQWAQSKATDDDLDAVTDDILLNLHDLRSVLVRKKADRLRKC